MSFIAPSTSDKKDKTSSGYQNSKKSHATKLHDTLIDFAKEVNKHHTNEDERSDIPDDVYEKMQEKKGGGGEDAFTTAPKAAKAW
ncbi:MAG: hypothetical protein Q9182_006873 [Xanthomendoza sp. 2 TL-2023]